MLNLERFMKVLRVFYTHYTEHSFQTHKYKRLKKYRDFSEHTKHDDAEGIIYDELGRMSACAPRGKDYAVVHGSSIVDDQPVRGKVDAWDATEQSLLSPEQLRATVSYAPNYKGRR